MYDEEPNLLDRIADSTDLEERALTKLHMERFVQAVWPEVCSLSLKQRSAFLLHLEREEILAFVQQGCCSLRQLADLLEIPAEEFAQLFGQLPLADEVTAARLKLTRRQIINLRKCARERLSRRLKVWTPS